MTDIDDDLRLAVECLIETDGVAGAIDELQARADAGRDGDNERALAALSWVRQEVADE
jgi:hypothetical protein